jgi:T5SS/PEP-CTERM-associated repeat protein
MKRLLARLVARFAGGKRATSSLLPLLLVAGAFPAVGADRTWDGGVFTDDGSFHDIFSWSSFAVPGAADYALFNLNSSYTVDWDGGGDVLNAGARFNGSAGIVTLDIGTRLWRLTNSLLIGSTAGADATARLPSGTLIVTNVAGNALVNLGSGGRGSLHLDGGALATDWLLATNSGTGFTNSRLLLNRGTLTTRRGSAIVQSNNFLIGNSNGQVAVWNISGGTNTITLISIGDVVIGSQADRRGQVNVTGGGTVWSNHAGLYLGSGIGARSNRLVVSGGARVSSLISYLGGSTGASNNFALVTDAGSVWDAGSQLTVGNYGPAGTLVISNGARLISDRGYLGMTPESVSNRVHVTGAGSSWTNRINLSVGRDATGCELLISDGAVVQSGALTISSMFFATNITNTVTVENGTLVVTNHTGLRDLVVGESGVGVLRLNGGLIHARRLLADRGPQSVLNLERGTLRVWNLQHSNGAPLDVGDGLNPARLELQPGGTNWLHGGLNVRAAGTLTGLGILAGHVVNTSGGTLAPGDFIGRLTVWGDLLLTAGSTNFFELNRALGTNDSVVGISNLHLGGTLLLTNLGGSLVPGDAFKLFGASQYSGAFHVISPASPGAGLAWDTSTLANDGTLRVVADSPFAIGGWQLLPGGALRLVAQYGPPSAPVQLLTSTNVALPVTNWTVLTTNQLDVNGSFQFTNPVVPGEPKRFFLLRRL